MVSIWRVILFDRLKNKPNSEVMTVITKNKKRERERLKCGNFKQFKSGDSKDDKKKETVLVSLNSELIWRKFHGVNLNGNLQLREKF